ncbi:MAG: SulP family inorganic anion transporter [Gammaproteobacteria bacterium]
MPPATARNWRGDVSGGFRAAIVSIPLALAFGVVSGAGPLPGFWGAVAVGLMAALFGGTPTQISGPTGPTALVLAAVLSTYHMSLAEAFTVVMLAGAMQIGLGVLRLGRYITLMPYPVISGWASGIGVTIILIQLGPLLGQPAEAGALDAGRALRTTLDTVGLHAVLVGSVSLAICLLAPARLNRLLPAPLLALLVGMALAATVFPDVPRLQPAAQLLPHFHFPAIEGARLQDILFAALMIALLGSIDSLLGSLAADTATNTWHNSERELVGQGLGNLTAGILGGIPGAGATLRTMTNIRAGGRTRLSGVVHAGILLAAYPLLLAALPHVPLAALAGVLISIALSIIDWRYLRLAPRAPRGGLFLMFTVLALTVFTNLLVAVAIGTILASLSFVKQMADLQLESVRTVDNPAGEASLSEEESALMDRMRGDVLLVQLSGPMSFGAANGLHRRLGRYQDYSVVILDFTAVPVVDSSAAMSLEQIISRARSGDHTVALVGVSRSVARVFARLGILDLIRDCDRHATRLDALRQAARDLGMEIDPAPAHHA